MTYMTRIIAMAALAVALGSPAWAQAVTGYWFFAPGGATAIGHTSFRMQMGGGAEFGITRGIAAGIEGGAIAPTHDFTAGVLGIASANGYYHFLHGPGSKVDPFATVGYSLLFRRGTANLLNYGGGLNYWAWPTVAFRFEVRDNVGGTPSVNYWGIRVGLSFTSLGPP